MAARQPLTKDIYLLLFFVSSSRLTSPTDSTDRIRPLGLVVKRITSIICYDKIASSILAEGILFLESRGVRGIHDFFFAQTLRLNILSASVRCVVYSHISRQVWASHKKSFFFMVQPNMRNGLAWCNIVVRCNCEIRD
jgi:hypothetical protein